MNRQTLTEYMALARSGIELSDEQTKEILNHFDSFSGYQYDMDGFTVIVEDEPQDEMCITINGWRHTVPTSAWSCTGKDKNKKVGEI